MFILNVTYELSQESTEHEDSKRTSTIAAPRSSAQPERLTVELAIGSAHDDARVCARDVCAWTHTRLTSKSTRKTYHACDDHSRTHDDSGERIFFISIGAKDSAGDGTTLLQRDDKDDDDDRASERRRLGRHGNG